MSAARLGIVVFARMSSQRLPGKVVMDFAGRPLLAHILARARAVLPDIVVATSTGAEDDPVAGLATGCGARVFRGLRDDVLQRAVDCADACGFDAFARLCADRPYFPQDQMREGLAAMARSFADGSPLDLVTNHIGHTPPPGLSTEVIRVHALRRALSSGADAHQREHLSAFLYAHAAQFSTQAIPADFAAADGQRLAVDTIDDYRALSRIAAVLGDVHAPFADAAALLQDQSHGVDPRGATHG